MHTFVKLTLRFTTNVTVSPTWRRRSSSAVTPSARRSRPAARASRCPSATETSPPASAPSRMRRTSREARSSAAPGLPASPVFMRFPDEPVGVDQRGHARAEQLLERRLRRVLHRDERLGAEVLHDHFLHVAVALVQIADGDEGVGALARRLADADQDARGERDRELARELDRPQAPARNL